MPRVHKKRKQKKYKKNLDKSSNIMYNIGCEKKQEKSYFLEGKFLCLKR